MIARPERQAAAASAFRPVLQLVGSVRLGNLEISTRLPGESSGDARRRERRERKQLRAAQQRALPEGRSDDDRDK